MMKMNTVYSIVFGFIFSANIAHAEILIIEDGDTKVTTQNLPTDGYQLIIEEGGTIETAPDEEHGVEMLANNQRVLNKGTISTQGLQASGIYNDAGTNATITNVGSISTQGQEADGIYNAGANATITNNGFINTEGEEAAGIVNNFGSDSTITNNGFIRTQGEQSTGIGNVGGANAILTNHGTILIQQGFAYGIYNSGVDSTITNSGTIFTQGEEAEGIYNDGGANISIINSGSISTEGLRSSGISIFGDDASITNRGYISTQGEFAHGIYSSVSDNTHIMNSGTIISEQGYAIHFEDSTNPLLTLQKGSNLQGDVGSIGDPLNLNVENGFNLLLTLSDDSEDFGKINSESPYILLNGKAIAVVENTFFALQEDVAADMSDTILGGINHDCCLSPCNCGWWTQTVCSYRHRSERDHTVEYSDWNIGQIVGYDTIYCGANIGVFGGYLYGEGDTCDPLEKLSHNTYFAGLSYTKKICDICMALTFAIGYVDWDQELYVMDNQAQGGVDRFRSDTSGTMITSELSLMKQFCCNCWNPRVSFYLRHAGFYLGNCNIKGLNASFTLKDRNIDILTTRVDVGFPTHIDCCSLEPFVGIYGRYLLRGNKLEFAGNGSTFDVGLEESLVAGIIGLRGKQCVCDKEISYSLSTDFDNEKSSRVLGSLGICF